MSYKLKRQTVEAERVECCYGTYYVVPVGDGVEMVRAAVFDALFEKQGEPLVVGELIQSKGTVSAEEMLVVSPPVEVLPPVKRKGVRPPAGAPTLTDKALAALEHGPLTTAELADRLYPEVKDSKKRADRTFQVLHKARHDGLVARYVDSSAGGLAKWCRVPCD